ncbi:MAG TPA: PHP domain-containing protein [Candidatus Udaeobacter sp.]|jgi:histidinol phosphatase-like PHP family hydrolase|nr:PHP domain-containing protein [Candidatus Udaeobacter sp.]
MLNWNRFSNVLSNIQIAELLAQQAERESGILTRAFRRAARSAFLWPEEIADLAAESRSLTELRAIGPFIEKQIRCWLDQPLRLPKTPSIRRDFISLAEARRLLAAKPEWSKNLRGDLQMHSLWSDGSGTVAEMADAAIEGSYEYIGITDHSKGLKIAGGIDEPKLEKQGAEIRKLNMSLRKSGRELMVLRSIEMNLNPRGEGDMSPQSLLALDLVLGSFHSSLRSTEDQTDRYLAALRNPHVHILGHPRGRIYNFRLGLTADWPRVFAEATRLDKALEVDCYPDRQDLNVQLLKLARDHGTRISLGTDAHHPWQLEFIQLGLAAVLTARVPPQQIVNFMPIPNLKDWIEQVRARSARRPKSTDRRSRPRT